MKVIEYLKEKGLNALVEEFKIDVKEYPDRVVLNYNQIESPRFNPIVDECRGLILCRDNWEVLSRSFDRFYNVGEGDSYKSLVISKSVIYEKLDGSLLSLYFDGIDWNVSTRSMAYAEGETVMGITFNALFNQAKEKTNINKMIRNYKLNTDYTYIFELTSPVNRVVTPYTETKITLIGIRNKITGEDFAKEALDNIAFRLNVSRPKVFTLNTLEEIVEAANNLKSTDEGFVITMENGNEILRVKCKNSKYLAIAHLRENGGLSPKNILHLVMKNDHYEYLRYFPEDEKYFEFVFRIYNESIDRIKNIYEKYKNIENRKEFALTIIPLCKYGHESGFIFNMKQGISFEETVKKTDSKRLAKSLNLRNKLSELFPEIKKFEEIE